MCRKFNDKNDSKCDILKTVLIIIGAIVAACAVSVAIKTILEKTRAKLAATTSEKDCCCGESCECGESGSDVPDEGPCECGFPNDAAPEGAPENNAENA